MERDGWDENCASNAARVAAYALEATFDSERIHHHAAVNIACKIINQHLIIDECFRIFEEC